MKIGNPNLKWAFSEVALLCKQNPLMKFFADELDKKHGKRKGRAVFTHKICRSVYYMLQRQTRFDPISFFGREKYERLMSKAN